MTAHAKQDAALRNMGAGLVDVVQKCCWPVEMSTWTWPWQMKEPRTIPLWQVKAICVRPPAMDTDMALRVMLVKLLNLIREIERQ